MRFDQGFERGWQEILAEQVSDVETWEILDRLARLEDFTGGSTVSAICEVTGSTPLVVSRILADIRGQSWQAEFGNRLDAHDLQLAEHEWKLERHDEDISELQRRSSGLRGLSSHDREVEEEMRRIAEERISERKAAPYYFVIMVIGVLFLLYVLAANRSNTHSSYTVVPGTTDIVYKSWREGK
jgi:hypothetical protein